MNHDEAVKLVRDGQLHYEDSIGNIYLLPVPEKVGYYVADMADYAKRLEEALQGLIDSNAPEHVKAAQAALASKPKVDV